MSNYKSELQSNNADLQSIANQIDELGDIVSEQRSPISQIKSALRGSCGTTVDDIGVFTCSATGDVQHLFIKGMTFGEWVDSVMNVPFYYNETLFYFWSDDFETGIRSDDDPWYASVTKNGVNPLDHNTVIEEINYIDWE